MHLFQPVLGVLARAQNNHQVDVAGDQLEVVAFGTKKLDRQGVEVTHLFLEPVDAMRGPSVNEVFPKLCDDDVSCIGCFIGC